MSELVKSLDELRALNDKNAFSEALKDILLVDQILNFGLKPTSVLEDDLEFIEKMKKVRDQLDSDTKLDLRWLVNRAYFVGYKNAETDGGTDD